LIRDGANGIVAPMPLSQRDRAILDLERSWWTAPGSKEEAIRRRLGLSPARYYRLLAALIDDSSAVAYDPLVVRRLRRTRERRRRARFEGGATAERRR
jgi:hypothetical protein